MSLFRRAAAIRRAALRRAILRRASVASKGSPFAPERRAPLGRRAGAAVLAFTGGAASLALLDPLALHLASKAHPGLRALFDAAARLSPSAAFLWPCAAGIAVLAALFRREASRKLSAIYQHGLSVLGFVVAACLSAWAVASALAWLIGRARPKLHETLGPMAFRPLDGSGDFASLPSAHAAIVIALAAALAFMLPKVRGVVIAVACCLAASRFMTGKNYLTDVLAGGALGWATAVAARRWFEARSVLFATTPQGARRVKGRELVSWSLNRIAARMYG
ncbi:MAG: phosphatase PAP2 family protein [Hyphomicrobiales bacterium]|nr:phosphatase PAP2 family protein [Hyphomicrobiales bacterium]